ncbi:MAG TPA: hypothetical protein DIW40_14895 [Halomonas sp.]|nr:hypothetical protein [Halomonas sp.]
MKTDSKLIPLNFSARVKRAFFIAIIILKLINVWEEIWLIKRKRLELKENNLIYLRFYLHQGQVMKHELNFLKNLALLRYTKVYIISLIIYFLKTQFALQRISL